MTSGRDRLIDAAQSLLAADPRTEPSTRDLYDRAGVAAPTLYHHFGTKAGLLDAVVEDAFLAYLDRKRAFPRSGDLLVDFATGWDTHIEFGVENPFLYELMYGRAAGRRSAAAGVAEDQLRIGLQRLAAAGLLTMDVEEAVAITTAMAIGCVNQLTYSEGSASSPIALSMRAALIVQLTETTPRGESPDHAARLVLAHLGSTSGLFSAAEEALLRQWLHAFADTIASTKGPRP